MKTAHVLAFAILAAAPLGAAALARSDADLALTKAGDAIESAERADAAQFAASDLAHAHALIEQAQAAYAGDHWTDAFVAAEHARLDADLASARSRQQSAEDAAARVERAVAALRDQLGTSAESQP